MKDQLEVRVRRSPKYSVFILMGMLLGLIVAGVLAVLPVDMTQLDGQYSEGSAVAFLMAFLGGIGGFLGAAVAVILDRISLRRARRMTVEAEFEPANEAEQARYRASQQPRRRFGRRRASAAEESAESAVPAPEPADPEAVSAPPQPQSPQPAATSENASSGEAEPPSAAR